MNRHEQREQAFILIFERTVIQNPIVEIIENAELSRDIELEDIINLSDFAKKEAAGAELYENEIDEIIQKYIQSWKISRLSKVSFALLRLGIYEMVYVTEIPVSVSINEVVELAKKYGGTEDAPFVNGVLGSFAKDLEAQNA